MRGVSASSAAAMAPRVSSFVLSSIANTNASASPFHSGRFNLYVCHRQSQYVTVSVLLLSASNKPAAPVAAFARLIGLFHRTLRSTVNVIIVRYGQDMDAAVLT